jgi:hypothetical protein
LFLIYNIMKLYSIHFNRPDFVEIQYQQSKKYNHELVIVNNGRNHRIKEVAEKLSVEYLETDNHLYGSNSHGMSINQILPLIDMQSYWGLIDHDLFITNDIEFGDYDIITQLSDNIPATPHMWPGFLICKGGVDLSDIDFRPGVGIPADTGSDTFRKVKDYKISIINQKYYGQRNKKLIQDSDIICQFYNDDKLLAYHYLNGSNWTGGDSIESKNKILLDLLNQTR